MNYLHEPQTGQDRQSLFICTLYVFQCHTVSVVRLNIIFFSASAWQLFCWKGGGCDGVCFVLFLIWSPANFFYPTVTTYSTTISWESLKPTCVLHTHRNLSSSTHMSACDGPVFLWLTGNGILFSWLPATDVRVIVWDLKPTVARLRSVCDCNNVGQPNGRPCSGNDTTIKRSRFK